MTEHVPMDGKALALAQELAAELHLTIEEVVAKALGELRQRAFRRSEVTPEEAEETYRFLRALSRATSKHKLPGATSDHDDFYDERGLPI